VIAATSVSPPASFLDEEWESIATAVVISPSMYTIAIPGRSHFSPVDSGALTGNTAPISFITSSLTLSGLPPQSTSFCIHARSPAVYAPPSTIAFISSLVSFAIRDLPRATVPQAVEQRVGSSTPPSGSARSA